jgi:hypothetical protein
MLQGGLCIFVPYGVPLSWPLLLRNHWHIPGTERSQAFERHHQASNSSFAPTTKSNHSYIREMNLLKLGSAAWIVILNLILAVTLVVVLLRSQGERFINYPQMPNPMAAVPSGTGSDEAAAANNNYAALLMFIQQNPKKSVKFITDIKQKFFKPSCEVKDMIDFANIAKLSNGMPFS